MEFEKTNVASALEPRRDGSLELKGIADNMLLCSRGVKFTTLNAMVQVIYSIQTTLILGGSRRK